MCAPNEILDQVRTQYSAVATRGLSSDHAGVKAVAEAFGYSAEELASIPAEANMGLSCGNPIATARLRAGEVVVDLGGCCGAPAPNGTSEIHSQLIDLLSRYNVNEFAASVRIFAVKPA